MLHANLRIKVGAYTGTGAYRGITGLGFRPDYVLIVPANTQHCVWKGSHIINSTSVYAGASLADATASDTILGLTSDGFTLGTNNLVNQSSIEFYYLAIQGSPQTLAVGDYIGTNVDNRNVTDTQKMDFTPFFTFIGCNGTVGRIYRCSGFNTGDSSLVVGSGGNIANGIQNQIANGFQIGSGSTVNTNGSLYHYMCLANVPRAVKAGTYAGTGVAQQINGVGFNPDFLLIKADGTTGGSEANGVWISTMPAGNARRITNVALATNRITSSHSDGFSVGTENGFNQSGFTYQYFALKAGDYNIELDRTPI
jgi:hypothetical protein